MLELADIFAVGVYVCAVMRRTTGTAHSVIDKAAVIEQHWPKGIGGAAQLVRRQTV